MDRSPAIVALLIVLTIGIALPIASVGASASDTPGERSVASAHIGAQDEGRDDDRSLQSVASAVVVANNTTQHDNPARVDSRDNADDIARWLEGRLKSRLERSAVELSQGQADSAERILGEEFADQFERYAYVAGRTEADSDDRTSERFRETKETQEDFATAIQEYRETHEEYEEARRNGNDDRARRLARELQRLAGTANRTGSTLQNDYRTLSNATAGNLDEASLAVGNTTRNISRQQAEVVEETFVRTALTLHPDSRQISFLDPLRLDGRLVGEDGSTLAERTVRFRVGEQTIGTRMNANGTFTVIYRPTLLQADEESVDVRFVPRNESVYLGSNGSVTVSVVQVTPDLTVDRGPEMVAFGDQLEVTGAVRAEGVGAEAVPIVVRLGGVRLGTTRTGPDGTYSFDSRVPASVDDGEQPLTATVPLEGRALAGTEQSTSVAVDPTATTVSVSGEQAGSESIRVSGALETIGSNGIPDQSVDLLVDGEPITTVQTGSNGGFTEQVSIPADLVDEDRNVSVTITARFDRPDSNLQPTRARTTLRLQPLEGGGGRIFPVPEGVPLALAVAVAVGGLLVLFGGAIYLRRNHEAALTTPHTGSIDSAGSPDSMEPPEPSTERTSPMLTAANAALDSDDRDTAVKLAYGALKRAMTERLGLPDGTHWEFFVACRETGLDDDHVDTLRRLTETYERAAFAPRTVSVADANWVVDAATELYQTVNTDEQIASENMRSP